MLKPPRTTVSRSIPGKWVPKKRRPRPSKTLNDVFPVAQAPHDDTPDQLKLVRDVELRKVCQQVLSDLATRQARDKKRTPIPAASARNYLLVASYREARKFVRKDNMAVVNDAVVAVARCKVAPSDPFATFLLLFSALQGEITKAARNQIRKQAIALAYAHRRKVPRWFLVGFIHQEGGLKRIVAKHMKASRKG